MFRARTIRRPDLPAVTVSVRARETPARSDGAAGSTDAAVPLVELASPVEPVSPAGPAEVEPPPEVEPPEVEPPEVEPPPLGFGAGAGAGAGLGCGDGCGWGCGATTVIVPVMLLW